MRIPGPCEVVITSDDMVTAECRVHGWRAFAVMPWDLLRMIDEHLRQWEIGEAR